MPKGTPVIFAPFAGHAVDDDTLKKFDPLMQADNEGKNVNDSEIEDILKQSLPSSLTDSLPQADPYGLDNYDQTIDPFDQATESSATALPDTSATPVTPTKKEPKTVKLKPPTLQIQRSNTEDTEIQSIRRMYESRAGKNEFTLSDDAFGSAPELRKMEAKLPITVPQLEDSIGLLVGCISQFCAFRTHPELSPQNRGFQLIEKHIDQLYGYCKLTPVAKAVFKQQLAAIKANQENLEVAALKLTKLLYNSNAYAFSIHPIAKEIIALEQRAHIAIKSGKPIDKKTFESLRDEIKSKIQDSKTRINTNRLLTREMGAKLIREPLFTLEELKQNITELCNTSGLPDKEHEPVINFLECF